MRFVSEARCKRYMLRIALLILAFLTYERVDLPIASLQWNVHSEDRHQKLVHDLSTSELHSKASSRTLRLFC